LITNAVECATALRPSAGAVAACRGRLDRDLDSYPRAAVVTLGTTALCAVTGQDGLRVTKVRGQTITTSWGPLVATLRPAAAVRRSAERPLLIRDLAVARGLAEPIFTQQVHIERIEEAPAPDGSIEKAIAWGEATERRFWSKVEKTQDCWYWLGSRDRWGYGQFSVAGKQILAHRFAYTMVVGPIPRGLTIDHLCRVPACVNPAHLEAVTSRENTERASRWNTQWWEARLQEIRHD
jgi:hypothetical protein